MRSLREITDQPNPEVMILIDSELFTEQVLLIETKVEEIKQNKHLDHCEDMIMRHGHDGFGKIFDALGQTHEFLTGGRRRPGYRITTKYDGSPAIVWGRDPKKGKFFVGTKSVFNKVPKLNFTPADIDKNHADSPALADKLKLLLKALPKTQADDGIYQGDLMYTSEDVSGDGKSLSFTPNTLTYKVPKDSIEGRKILKSKIGIVPHTRYTADANGQLHASFDVDMSKFKSTDDVYIIDPTVRSGKFKYPTADQKSFLHNIKRAHNIHRELIGLDGYKAVENHNQLVIAYVNDAIKNRVEPSVTGYIHFLNGQFKKKSDSVKMASTKDRIKGELDNEVKNIVDHKAVFEKLFALHKHVTKAKDILVNVLSQNSPFEESILGEPSKPEGFVVSTTKGGPVKLVDRSHFSSANFEWNQKVNPADNPTVLSFGRFNPPTIGHGRMLAKGADIARRIGAKQVTVATRSQDPERNPLPIGTKLKWLKTMFPGQNVSIAAKQSATLIAQLQQMNLNGVKDLTIVAGSDRIPEYQRILAKYNGPEPDKLFNFRRARVISGGERDPDAEGATGMSASKMRDAAKAGDYKGFRTGVPSNIDEPTSQEMFHTLRADMGVVKIGPDTDGHALAIYMKRKDAIGQQAQAEINNRKRQGTWHGQ